MAEMFKTMNQKKFRQTSTIAIVFNNRFIAEPYFQRRLKDYSYEKLFFGILVTRHFSEDILRRITLSFSKFLRKGIILGG